MKKTMEINIYRGQKKIHRATLCKDTTPEDCIYLEKMFRGCYIKSANEKIPLYWWYTVSKSNRKWL